MLSAARQLLVNLREEESLKGANKQQLKPGATKAPPTNRKPSPASAIPTASNSQASASAVKTKN